MEFDNLRRFKEKGGDVYNLALMDSFMMLTPTELADFLIENPESSEFVDDYVSNSSCYSGYRNRFYEELRRRGK